MSIKIREEDALILNDIWSVVHKFNNIIITTHKNPDGDAIGSALGLHLHFKSLNKNSRVIINGPVPYNYKFLSGINDIEIYNDSHFEVFLKSDLIFVVDLNDVERTLAPANAIKSSKAVKVVIDHHIDPKEFADLYFVNTEATSAGELVYFFCRFNNNGMLSSDISTCLYLAIMTDSGSFRFPRTDGNTHRIIAELIDSGADPVNIYENVYNIRPAKVVKLLGEAFAGLQILQGGKLCVMTLTRENFKNAGAIDEDVEDIVEQSLTIEHVQVGLLLSEHTNLDEIRVSFRSKGDISVRDIALKFDGGGHKNAAGARFFNMKLEDVRRLLISEIRNIL